MNKHISIDAAPDAVASTALSVTVVTSTRPATLTKHFSLEEGNLVKIPGGQLVKGFAEIREVRGLWGFAELLLSLKSNQALVYGLAKGAPIELTTKKLWQQAGSPDGRMPRTADMFSWSTALGILMLDYDPESDTNALTRDELVASIRQAVPGLTGAKFLWWPSASSHIFDVRTNVDLTGLRGQRLYVLVKDARDIPRAGRAIVDALWLAGHGFVKVSNSGQLLMRTIVDATVWQTNRFDFAAGASCSVPLEQRRGEPVLIPGALDVVDTKLALPGLTSEEQASVEAARSKARSAMQPQAQEAREAWINRWAEDLAGPDGDQRKQEAARATARSAVEHGLLTGDYRIVVLENDAEITATISEVLSDPQRFDGLQTLDPLEPDYKGRRAVGMLFLLGRTSCLFSFAHGGTTYRLLRQLDEIELKKGKTREAVDATLEILRVAPNVFDMGDALVVVEAGRLSLVDEAALGYDLAGRIQYWRWHTSPGGAVFKVLEDPPARLLKTILSLRKQRGLKQLNAVITAPTLRLDGTILDEPGYDAETRLYLDRPGPPDIEIKLLPNAREVDVALDILLSPFRDFPFVDRNDCGVMLAALLTAVVRPTLPTCPAFGFDAPVQGSGKSLLAECIGWLATGTQPRLYPHTGGRGDDDEVRKRIFSALIDGQSAIIWDNVVGTFDSAAMAAAITSENYTDRVLGKSETLSVPNRQLTILTGNNLTLAGDMSRRVL